MLFSPRTSPATVLRYFNWVDDTLSPESTSTLFVPLLIGTGGNAGSQTVGTIIRGLALGEIEPRDALRVLGREVRPGLFLGLMLGPRRASSYA